MICSTTVASRQSYLVRGPDGRMNTIIAHSVRGALKLWMALNPREGGDVSVKVRGEGDWHHFKVN